MPSYGSKWPQYAKQWDSMQVRPSKQAEFNLIARRLVTAKERYLAVQNKTGVPWYVIALIHEREASQNFNTQLGQGDPLGRVSTHIPRGMGPYTGPGAWERAAVDALHLDKLDKVIDWRLEKCLYYLELYNGWGYASHGVPSAYVWAGSTVYSSGKYIADGVWSSSAVDSQAGCAPLLKCMMNLDPTIKPKRESSLPDIIAPVGTVIAGGTAASQAPSHLVPYIIGGTVVIAILAYLLLRWLKKDTTNVVVAENKVG